MSLLLPDKEQWLLNKNWIKDYDSETMIKFVKIVDDRKFSLYIQYSKDGKHYCNLYSGHEDDPDCKYFSLRNIKSMIQRYAL